MPLNKETKPNNKTAQSAGAVEYANCIFVKG